jgi:hypothetical protein
VKLKRTRYYQRHQFLGGDVPSLVVERSRQDFPDDDPLVERIANSFNRMGDVSSKGIDVVVK